MRCYYSVILILTLCAKGQAQSTDPFIAEQGLIFDLQSQHTHGSSVLALPNGDVLAAWFQGSGERTADDVLIMGARKTKGSTKWSKPFVMADTKGIPDCNPVLFINGEEKLFLCWIAVMANKWEASILRFKTSVKYAKTGPPEWNWQDNILLKPDDQFAMDVKTKLAELPNLGRGWAEYAPEYDRMIAEASEDPVKRNIGWMTRIKPLILPTGRILLPLYSDGFNLSLVAISDDDGTTWQPSSPIVGRGPIQPALIRKENGTIVAWMRDSGDAPSRVHRSESTDDGQSWTPTTKTDIPNTASVDVLKISDGRWLFVGNDIDDGRYRLALFVSDDEGQTWSHKYYLENMEKNEGGFSYPCVMLGPDSMVHITYSFHLPNDQKSIKYVKIDPDQIPGN